MIPFVEKYRPINLESIKGQDKPISDFRNLIGTYKKGKAIMIYGGHGVGKTSSVHALANDLNYEILEINASDTRNKEQIQKIKIGQARSLLFRLPLKIALDAVLAFLHVRLKINKTQTREPSICTRRFHYANRKKRIGLSF